MNQAQKIQSGVDFDDVLAAGDKRVTVDVPVLFDEDGDAKAGFRIVGKNSPEYLGLTHVLRVEGLKKSSKKKTAMDTSTDEGADQFIHLVKGNEGRVALAIVVETFGFSSGGKEIQLTEAQKKAAFEKFPTWQASVLAALDKDADFLKV